MKYGNIVVLGGLLTLIIGAIIVSSAADMENKLAQAQGGGLFAGLASIAVYLAWARDSLTLLILNLFISGLTLILVGLELRKR